MDVYLHRKPEKGHFSTSAIFWKYHWHPKLHSFVLKGKHILLSHLRPQETRLQSKKHRQGLFAGILIDWGLSCSTETSEQQCLLISNKFLRWTLQNTQGLLRKCHIDHVQFPTQGLQKQPLGIKQEWAKPQSTLWEEDRRGFDVVASEGHCIRTCHAVHALLIQDP